MAYERRISDWSADVCSSDLKFESPLSTSIFTNGSAGSAAVFGNRARNLSATKDAGQAVDGRTDYRAETSGLAATITGSTGPITATIHNLSTRGLMASAPRSEEHTSELQSLMRSSYDVFCLKQKKYTHIHAMTD